MKFSSVMRKCLVTFALVATAFSFAISPAFAGMDELMVMSIDNYQEVYFSHKQALLDAPEGQWTDKAMQDYIKSSTYLIHWAAALALERNGYRHVSSGEELMAMGLLPEWPGDPLNDWSPIGVTLTPGEFQPLTAVLDICPVMYTTRGQRLSFEIYMLGPTIDWPLAETDIMEQNQAWAYPPTGTAFCVGIHFQDDAEIAAFKLRIKEFLVFLDSSLENAG